MRKSLLHSAMALILAGGLAAPTFADGTLDGSIGGGYGAAVATDPPGDSIAPGSPVDLTALYVVESGSDVFIGITYNNTSDDWGKYLAFIGTDNAANTAGNGDGNGWSRPIQPDGVTVTPSYFIGSWVDGGTPTMQLFEWNGSAWTGGANDTGNIAWSAANGTVEFRVAKSSIGNPNTVNVVAMASGGGGGDTAIDTVPSHSDPGGWGDPVTITSWSGSIVVPVELSAFGLD